MKKHIPLIALLLIMVLGHGLKTMLTPALYFPYQVMDAPDELRVIMLQQGYRDPLQCARTLNAITQAIQSSCPSCVVAESTCPAKLDANQRKWLTDTPLEVPSARMPNGVSLFESRDPSLALATCHEAERQTLASNQNTRVNCHPAGKARPLPAPQQKILSDAMATRDMFLLAILALGLALAALLLTSHRARLRFVAAAGPQADKLSLLSRLPRFYWTQKLTLAGVDALVLLLAFAVVVFPAADDLSAWLRLDPNSLYIHCALVALVIGWFWVVLEHYGRRRTYFDELREIFHVVFIALLLSSTTVLVIGADISRIGQLLTWALGFILIPLGRMLSRELLDSLGLWKLPAVIIGSGENAREAYLAIKHEDSLGYVLCAFINPPASTNIGSDKTSKVDHDIPLIQAGADLNETLTMLGKPQVIVALDSLALQGNQAMLQSLIANHSNIHIVPSLRGLPLFGTELSHFFSYEVLFLTARNNLARRTSQWIKRIFDILGSSVLLVILLPLFAWIGWRIRQEDGGSILFTQERIGKEGRSFRFIKFRSMAKDADAVLANWREQNPTLWEKYRQNNFKLQDDPRITRTGRWLRRSSFDELPQLWNVLIGEMSLVGPRPLLERELPDYGYGQFALYRLATPGLTGLWQISGRSQTTFADRAALDSWYVQNWSMWYDIAILFRTISVVLNRQGAY